MGRRGGLKGGQDLQREIEVEGANERSGGGGSHLLLLHGWAQGRVTGTIPLFLHLHCFNTICTVSFWMNLTTSGLVQATVAGAGVNRVCVREAGACEDNYTLHLQANSAN